VLRHAPVCIPLHGSLKTLRCSLCAEIYSLADYRIALAGGVQPPCPNCKAHRMVRRLGKKRLWKTGVLEPTIVMYNDPRPVGSYIDEAVRMDLNSGGLEGDGALSCDLLLVTGTSLQIPGAQNIVRRFSQQVHSAQSATRCPKLPGDLCPQLPIGTIFVNQSKVPKKFMEWFDVWVEGDIQCFAELLSEALQRDAT
jgi:NAD-dependent histone deacetylase SIR2